MTAPSRKKLPKSDRRRQLLDVARAFVAERGVDALKLGALAERAGVSKPVVYEHFGTRSGLLVALYRDIDARQFALLEQALRQTAPTLPDVARTIAVSYMDCCLAVGPEWHAIRAALQGDEQMTEAHRDLLDGYAALYGRVLAPFTDASPEDLRLLCVGLIGAAEAVSMDMLRGQADPERAASVVARLIVRGLGAAGPPPPSGAASP